MGVFPRNQALFAWRLPSQWERRPLREQGQTNTDDQQGKSTSKSGNYPEPQRAWNQFTGFYLAFFLLSVAICLSLSLAHSPSLSCPFREPKSSATSSAPENLKCRQQNVKRKKEGCVSTTQAHCKTWDLKTGNRNLLRGCGGWGG